MKTGLPYINMHLSSHPTSFFTFSVTRLLFVEPTKQLTHFYFIEHSITITVHLSLYSYLHCRVIHDYAPPHVDWFAQKFISAMYHNALHR
jgi:hypothetical protein